jgi:membrane protein DedA with SNARE-associated domain
MTGIGAELVSALTGEMAKLQPVLDQYGLWALFVAALVEGFGIPLPGQTLLIACGLLAAKGQLEITAVLLVGWVATQLGDVVGYLIGRGGVHKLITRSAKNGAHLAKAEALFARYGVAVLIIARFVDGVRQASNIVAGALEMGWWRFMTATMIGTTLWVAVCGFGAFSLGKDFHVVGAFFHWLRPYAWTVTLAFIALLGLYLLRRRKVLPPRI